MTFTYDNANNKYDGKTIQYKVTATTDAPGVSKTVLISVIDKTTKCLYKSL